MTFCHLGGTYPYRRHVCVRYGTIGAIADIEAPTPGEIAGMMVLNDDFALTRIIGWEPHSETVIDSNWGIFRQQRNGHITVHDARLIFAADLAGIDIRKVMFRGRLGLVVIQPSGCHRDDAPVHVFPTNVAHVKSYTGLQQQGAEIEVKFTIPTDPAPNVFPAEAVSV